jgi:hypothetical protein
MITYILSCMSCSATHINVENSDAAPKPKLSPRLIKIIEDANAVSHPTQLSKRLMFHKQNTGQKIQEHAQQKGSCLDFVDDVIKLKNIANQQYPYFAYLSQRKIDDCDPVLLKFTKTKLTKLEFHIDEYYGPAGQPNGWIVSWEIILKPEL